MTSTNVEGLTRHQAAREELARKALAEAHGYDPAGMAKRIGALEWHLAEMISLVGELAGNGQE